MKHAIRPGMVVVDVGGERGYNTLIAAKRVGPRGRVLVFEPREDILGLLRANATANGHANVTACHLALSDTEGTVSIRNFQMYSGADADGPAVRCATFDSLPEARAFGRVGFVKVDAEGAELQVLRGMEQTLVRDKPELPHGYRIRPLMASRRIIGNLLENKSTEKCRFYCRPSHKPS